MTGHGDEQGQRQGHGIGMANSMGMGMGIVSQYVGISKTPAAGTSKKTSVNVYNGGHKLQSPQALAGGDTRRFPQHMAS